MWDVVRSIFGEATVDEVALTGVLFVVILLFSWAPQLGEAIGNLFEGDDDPAA